MREGVQVGVRLDGAAVTTEAGVRKALEAVGLGAVAGRRVEAVDPVVGVWLVTLPTAEWARLESAGWIELSEGHYEIMAETT